MMNKCTILLLMAIIGSVFSTAIGQERPPIQRMGNAVISPEVGDDGTVTFRYVAPNAKEVIVSGELDGNVYPMTPDTNGVWSVTIGPLSPDIYTYSFFCRRYYGA
ncbi:hypothetical protein JW824_03175 [bacterium]|nr:hypothetical protein [bacterium]RQV98048.1 MAG: hypothetical protein EH221_02820 [bacterium]